MEKDITLKSFLNQHPTFIENLKGAATVIGKKKDYTILANALDRYYKELKEFEISLGWQNPFK